MEGLNEMMYVKCLIENKVYKIKIFNGNYYYYYS